MWYSLAETREIDVTEKNRFEIACAQVLQKESSVFSIQWTVLPSSAAMTPEKLLERYLVHIRRFTAGIIRPVRSADGIVFRLALFGIDLLAFRGPVRDGAGKLTLSISGGALLARGSCGPGELTFGCEGVPGGTQVLLRLADYCPLLLGPSPGRPRKWFYRFTQAAIHRLVTVRFLVRLQREVAGKRICCRVVRIPGMEGEPI